MFAFVDTVARRLVRRGLRKGLLEGNPAWIGVLAVALFVRLVLRPQRPQVRHERLRLGETLTVTHAPPPGRARGAPRGPDRAR